MALSAGPLVVRLIVNCFKARIPVLLIGSYGIGKSDLLAAAAEELGVPLIVRDLSIMEPPDLVGIPRVNGNDRTVFAPPAFLPRDGEGLILMEELNRAPTFMRASCLQLLTARRLNDYILPPGWLPVASINPAEGAFQVDTLDPALESRFMKIFLRPEVAQWLAWARDHAIHPAVMEFVERTPRVLDDPVANPRAWTYVSRFLDVWEALTDEERGPLQAAVAGLVSERWSEAFKAFYSGDQPLAGEQVEKAYPYYRAVVRRWAAARRLDRVEATLAGLMRHLQDQPPERLAGSGELKENLALLLEDVPPDMANDLRDWLRRRLPDLLDTDPRDRK